MKKLLNNGDNMERHVSFNAGATGQQDKIMEKKKIISHFHKRTKDSKA